MSYILLYSVGVVLKLCTLREPNSPLKMREDSKSLYFHQKWLIFEDWNIDIDRIDDVDVIRAKNEVNRVRIDKNMPWRIQRMLP